LFAIPPPVPLEQPSEPLRIYGSQLRVYPPDLLRRDVHPSAPIRIAPSESPVQYQRHVRAKPMTSTAQLARPAFLWLPSILQVIEVRAELARKYPVERVTMHELVDGAGARAVRVIRPCAEPVAGDDITLNSGAQKRSAGAAPVNPAPFRSLGLESCSHCMRQPEIVEQRAFAGAIILDHLSCDIADGLRKRIDLLLGPRDVEIRHESPALQPPERFVVAQSLEYGAGELWLDRAAPHLLLVAIDRGEREILFPQPFPGRVDAPRGAIERSLQADLPRL
jgi:hypothetical protein